MNVRTIGIIFAGVAALATATAGVAQQTSSGPVPLGLPTPAAQVTLSPVQAPRPTLTIPPENMPIVSQTPAAPAARGRREKGAAPSEQPSGTPAPPDFTNLSGDWEIELQPGGSTTVYSHFRMQQNPDGTVTGYWERGNKMLPFNGNFDGRQFKFTVQDGKTQETFAGYEDNFSDMVGLVDQGDGKPPVAFTAEHRKKSEFLNGLNIGPGIGTSSGAGAGGL